MSKPIRAGCTAITLAMTVLTSPASMAADKLVDSPPIPILAWGGPPQDQTTIERYRELAEAGFTHNYSGFATADAMGKALDVGKATGIKLFLSNPELMSDPEGTVKQFKGHPALAGYYLRDEPAAGDFDALAKWARRIQAVDSDHPSYINLFPNYATDEQLGTAGYRAYVERFVKEVPVPLLSFDHYPVVGQSLRGQWYENLEIVSAAARAANKPFWAFALATAHGPYPVPTLAHLRVQMFSNLAYGAQGLQYFTYWTSKSDTWNFHGGPIGQDGKRTDVYERVREVNHQVQGLRGVFLGSRVVSVGHTGKQIPQGTRRFEPAGPVKSVETQESGAVVSVLENTRRKFLVIVNRDVEQAMKLRVAVDGSVGAKRVEENGTLQALTESELRLEVSPGDVAIVSWERSKAP